GKDQRARIVHRGMGIEFGWIRKTRPVERQAVCLSFFCHPNKRDVGEFSSDVAAPNVRMSSREPDLLNLRADCRRSRPERRNELVSMLVDRQCMAPVLHDIAGTGVVKAVLPKKLNLRSKMAIRLRDLHKLNGRVRSCGPVVFPRQSEIAKLLALQYAAG